MQEQDMDLSQDCYFQSLAIMDQLSFATWSMSVEIRKFCSTWNIVFKTAKYSSLIFLFGAAGGILYFWKRRKKKEYRSLFLHNQPKYSILERFIERLSLDEFLEDDMFEFGNRSLEYERYSSKDLEGVNDLSCNLQFIRKPLNNKHKSENIEGSHISNSCSKSDKCFCSLKKHQQRKSSLKPSDLYSESPIINTKTSTPELSTCEELNIQRIKASNRLGHHLRTEVCGPLGAIRAGVAEWPVSPVSRSCACDSQCLGLEITRDTSVVSGGMRDLVQNAKQVRRLIREASFDSQASDFDLDIDDDIGDKTIVENKHADDSDSISLISDYSFISSKSSTSDLSFTGAAFNAGHGTSFLTKKLQCNKKLWKLTGFSDMENSTFSDCSEYGKVSLEWEHLSCDSASVDTYNLAEDSNLSNLENVSACSGVDLWGWNKDSIVRNKNDASYTGSESSASMCAAIHSSGERNQHSSLSSSSYRSTSSDSISSRVSGDSRHTIMAAIINQGSQKSQMNASTSSEESGFLDDDCSLDSSTGSSIFPTNTQMSPVREATEPSSSPSSSPESVFVADTDTNTVIKVNLNSEQKTAINNKVSRGLFQPTTCNKIN